MRSTLVLCRIVWGLGAISAVAVVAALILDLQLALVPLMALAGIMGGVTTSLWYVYARPNDLSGTKLIGSFVFGAVLWVALTNPISMLLGFGLLAAAWLPLAVVAILAATFRPVVLGALSS